MLSFFSPRKNEKFATIINGDNIYSGADGYGNVMSHRNIGMLYPNVESAESRVKLMKHITFCTDKYGFPKQNDLVYFLDYDNEYRLEDIEFDINKHLILYCSGLVMPMISSEAQERRLLLGNYQENSNKYFREYSAEEASTILNSY